MALQAKAVLVPVVALLIGLFLQTTFAAADAASALVNPQSASKPLPVYVTVDGDAIPPAHGSAAGVWFYAHRPTGAQLLLTGHPTVPGSWRLTAVFKGAKEIRLVFAPESEAALKLAFRAQPLSASSVECLSEPNALAVRSADQGGAVFVTGFCVDGRPALLTPIRRPFSREPVEASPDLHPTIADALVEWDWRMQDGIQTPREPRTYGEAIEKLMRQTDALVTERYRSRSLRPDELREWEDARAVALADRRTESLAETNWLRLHRTRRKILLSTPVFTGFPILFVKHVPSVMSHQLTQVYGYCARPGGGLFSLPQPGVTMRTRELTPATLRPGNFMTPELSFDAKRLLFAYCPVNKAPVSWDFNEETARFRYHLYELSLVSGNVRPLTSGDTDNFSPIVLPCGDLVLLSTRRGGFHRCGRGPCFVYTLARMGPDGQNPRSISFHETHEWDPCLLNDGRLIYTRWDYVDRNAVHYEQLWSALPDGSSARIFFGNNTWNPTGIWEPRPIPGSSRVMAIAAPHHGMSAGSVLLVDTDRGVDGLDPLTRLTPDVRFPESESPLAFGPSPGALDFDTPVSQHWRAPLLDSRGEEKVPEEEKRWPGHCYKSPWPLSETFFIVSYSFDQLLGEPGPNIPNMFGIYFADAFGNKELIYRDPAISSLWARPMARRNPPVEIPPQSAGERSSASAAPETGTFFVSDVMESWPALPGGTAITHLRIVQVLLKTTPNADSPRVGAAFAAPGKQVLGTVPVEPDGSAFFEIPAKTPVLFQALDQRGRAVQTMRSLAYLQPGEHQSCVGCHEHRASAVGTPALAQALMRPPSKLQPGPEGSRPFSYPRLVQPVLDAHCVSCHNGTEPQRPVLTGQPDGAFTKSYNSLVQYVSFSAWGRPEQNFEPLTEPLRFGAAASKLIRMLDQGHGNTTLSREDMDRLHTWIDSNALFYGTFDIDDQQRQLAGQRIGGPKE